MYTKLVDDKDDGVIMVGTYIGGIGATTAECDTIARECVVGVRGGVAMPKIVPLDRPIQECVSLLNEQFTKLFDQIIQAEQIMARDR
jgi:hypothetical protein